MAYRVEECEQAHEEARADHAEIYGNKAVPEDAKEMNDRQAKQGKTGARREPLT